MRKLFKSVDDKLEKAGFRKIEESECIVSYVLDVGHGLTQTVNLLHEASGMRIIHSCDKGLMDRDVRLFVRKMKEKGWGNQ